MMDAYKQLCIEYPGIKDIIWEYTSDGSIGNFVQKLGEAIEMADLETIKYTITEINKWYTANIVRISENQFVHESAQEDHLRVMALVKQWVEAFENYQFDPDFIAAKERARNHLGDKIIFLSHSSKNSKYGDALRNFISALGVKNHQLVYTSHPLHIIPLDKNIFDYLRDHISANVFVIILWSNEYLESPACLNEMGGAWVVQSDHTNIYVPDFSFGNPKYHECAVDTRQMGAVLNGNQHCKISMLELKDKIEAMFGLCNDEKTITCLIDQFMNEIGD